MWLDKSDSADEADVTKCTDQNLKMLALYFTGHETESKANGIEGW